MVPVCERPYALVTGELTDLKFYGPTPEDDTPNGFRGAREQRLDHVGDTWQLVPLHDLGKLHAIDADDGVPDNPIEDMRADFLALAAEARANLAEAERLADAANQPGQSHLAEQASSVVGHGYELMDRAFALAEELLA
jgi:hypothetical protein